MTSLDLLRNKIKNLYEQDPNIHINIQMTSPRISLKNEPVIIKGVYPRIFKIEETTSGFHKSYTIQYAELITKQVEVLEL